MYKCRVNKYMFAQSQKNNYGGIFLKFHPMPSREGPNAKITSLGLAETQIARERLANNCARASKTGGDLHNVFPKELFWDFFDF